MRIVGVEVPDEKQVLIGLTYIKGIGRFVAKTLLDSLNIEHDRRVKNLNDHEAAEISNYIENNLVFENGLRKNIEHNIKRLISINCFRGTRHNLGLPISGRTKTNAKTHKKLRNKGKKFYLLLV